MIFLKANSTTTTPHSNDVALRKSDRRKLLQIIQEEANPNLSKENNLALLSTLHEILTSNNSDVLKRKLPRPNATNKKKDVAIIYLRTPSSSSSFSSSNNWPFKRCAQPIFLEITYEKKNYLAPCLSTLSLCPTLLPIVYIHPGTSKFICRGANLMSVGIIQHKSLGDYSSIPIKSLVSITVIGNPMPFACGIWNGLKDASGVGVLVLLGYGDDLWRMQLVKDGEDIDSDGVDDGHYGNKGFINGTHVEAIVDLNVVIDEGDENGEGNETKDIDNENVQESKKNDQTEENDNETEDDDDDDDKDEKLINLFYKSLLTVQESALPMPVSTFYAKNFKPILLEESISLEKDSSFKKISFLFQFLQQHYIYDDQDEEDENDTGFTLSEDRNLLLKIDKSHTYYRRAKREFGNLAASSSTESKRKVQLVNLYTIPKHIVELMNLNNGEYDITASKAKTEERRDTGFLTTSECRDILFQYCIKNNLDQKSSIAMNDILTKILFKNKSALKKNSSQTVIPTHVKKKEIIELWTKALQAAYAIVLLPQNTVKVMKRGTPPKIRMEVERRGGGNKKFITRVYNLEEYNINAQLFSDDISKRFGCSCAANEFSKKNSFEVMIQGYLADDVQFLLTCGEEGRSNHGNASKQTGFVLNYELFYIPKGVIDIVLKKGVAAKKR